MQTTQTNQQILFAALSAVVLPQFQQPAALVARRETTLARAERQGVQHCVTLPVPFEHPGEWRLYPGQVYDWALMRIEDDPLYRDRRGFPMPRPIIVRLRTLKRQGCDFDQLWIAHEVAKGSVRAGQVLTVADLMPAPKPKRQGWLLPVLAGLVGMAYRAATAPVDPILFGVNVEPATTTPRPATTTPRPAALPPATTPTTQPAAHPAEQYRQRDMGDMRKPATNVYWGDAKLYPPEGSVLRPDLSQRNIPPVVEMPNGEIIYPSWQGIYDGSATRAEYLAHSCEVDPILLGVNLQHDIADLFFLGAWAYGA